MGVNVTVGVQYWYDDNVHLFEEIYLVLTLREELDALKEATGE